MFTCVLFTKSKFPNHRGNMVDLMFDISMCLTAVIPAHDGNYTFKLTEI